MVGNRKGRLETGFLTFAWFAFLFPLVWITTPLLAFADYSLRPGQRSPEIRSTLGDFRGVIPSFSDWDLEQLKQYTRRNGAPRTMSSADLDDAHAESIKKEEATAAKSVAPDTVRLIRAPRKTDRQ